MFLLEIFVKLVVPKGTRADTKKICVKSSPIWRSVSTLHLKTNMRVHFGGGNTDFQFHLLSYGHGTIPNDRGIISVDSKLGKIVTTIILFLMFILILMVFYIYHTPGFVKELL